MAEPVDNKKQFTAEEIKSKLNSINSYMDANRPEILAGIQAANAERDAEQAQKDYKISLLKPSGAVAKASIPKVQNELVGNRYTGPNPKLLSGGLKPGSLDHINSLIEKSKIDAAQLSDPLATARLTSFDGSHRGYNFDRYYSHDKYSEGKDGLGFSIYRDNEGIYNKNTSFADEFGRMSSKWLGLAWQGGSGLFKNWGRFGAIGEEEDADKMAADLSAATSTKTGAGAWTVNFLANSAYTMGILAEIGIEAGIAGLLFPESGGASGVAFAARLGKNVKRMGDAMSTLTKVLKGADKARTFYTQAKGLATGAAKTLLPGTNTIDLMRLASKPNSAYNRLDDFAKMRKSFGAFYKDLREINAVTAESRLEAGFAKNEVLDKGLKAFYQKNNRYPTAEESYELNKAANDAASTAFLANAPAIFYSNRIVLGTALKGFRPIRNAMTKLGLDSNVYKVIRNFNKPLADGRIPLEVVSRGLRSSTKRVFTKEYLKSIPTRLVHPFSKDGAKQIFGGGYRFMNANLAEGLQESYQEAVQAGVEDYYLNSYFEHLYSDPHLSANRSLMASILGYGVGQQFSTQGLDVFAQGFLMGGVVGPVQNSIMRYGQRGLMVAKDKFNKTNSYAEYVTNEEKRLNEYVNAVNNVMQHRAKHAIWLDENVAKQRDLAAEYEQNQAQGNRVAAENNKDESLFSHVFTLSQAGKLDIWLDQLEDLRSLSDTELAEAFQEYEGDVTDENSKSYRERLESAINKSKSIKNRIDRINDEVENPYDPDIIDRDKSPEAYKAEKIGWETFEMAKRAAIFNEYTFERTVSRLDSLINNAAKNSPIGDVAGLEYSILYNNELELINYVSLLQNEIDGLDKGDKAQKTLARKKETQLKSLMDLRDSMDFIREKKKLIELAKKAALDPKNASEESKNALEQLKKEAVAILKDMDIISIESARMHLLDRGLTEDEIANLERENERNRTYGSVLGESGQYTIDFEKAEQENVIAPDVIILEKYKDDLYAAYAKYVKNIADLKNVFPIQGGLERSFSDLVDFLELSDDARWLSQYANILSNPMAIHDMALRMKNAKSAVAERELELIKKGLEDYKNNILNVDDLLQKLMDIGVYFPKEFIKNFRNKKILPPYFLDIDTHKKIQPADPKFDAIIKLINQDELDKNIKYLNKPSRPAPPPAPSGSAPVVAPPPEDTEDDISETPANPEHNVLTPFNELGDSVKNKLRELHQKAISENGATDDIQEWMRDSAEAAQVIAGTYKDETPVVLSTSNAVSGAITVDNPRSFSTPTADLKPIFVANEKEGWKLTPDETGYTNINRPEKERTVVKRVSDLKGTKPEDNAYLKASQKRGNVIDGLFRWFIEPHQNPSTNKPELSLKDQIINRILAGASAAQIKQEIETVIRSQGEYLSNKEKIKLTDSFYSDMAEVLYEMTNRYQSFNWHINLPTMVGTLNNEQYGGTIDLLLEKGGKYYIIDFKSSAKRRAGNDVYEEGDLIQQNAYADLFEQITGKKISKLYILNVKSKLSSDLKSVDSIELIKRTTVDRTGKKVTKILDEIPRIPIDTQFNGSKTTTSPATPAPTSKDFTEILSKAQLEENIQYLERKLEDLTIKAEDSEDPAEFADDIDVVKAQLKELKEQLGAEGTQTPGGTPSKTKVPSRFAGKLIWAQYGTVDPKIFEEYDVINADDVFNKVAAEMGIVANPNLSLAQTVELYRSSSDKSENAKANQIYTAVRNYIKELKSQGKTIVAYNWFLQQNADIISSPPKEKATFLNDAKTPEESIELFEKFITMYPARASAYDATQLKGWESIVNNTEKKTRSTVRELFEKGSLTSTPIDNIQNADVSIGYQGLIDILAAYLANPDVQNLYTITDIDNTLRVAPKETIIEMVKDKIKTFSQLLEKEPGNVEETKEALDTVDSLVSKYNPSAKPNEISSEDKSKASEIVANPLTDPSAAAQTFAEAANSTQEDVDNQFTKTLGC